MHQGFVILDFGSQVSQLIARRLRELGYYSELISARTPIEDIRAKKPFGIILSGGSSSVYDKGAPDTDIKALLEIAPLMGICYGMQLIAHKLGGIVAKSETREYGKTSIEWNTAITNVPKMQNVWMSHGDVIEVPPAGFEIVALSKNGHAAAMHSRNVLALQFHPEVEHTEYGTELIHFFCEKMCQAQANWKTKDVLKEIIIKIKQQVPNKEKVLCALSGGVDSTVVGRLLTEALGADRVFCVFVDNGLLRKNEYQSVLDIYETIGLNVKGINAEKIFLDKLKGVSDPETKRKIIGHTFIDVFKAEIKNHKDITHLAQGTLYPDVIESVSPNGESVTIKSHHNVGGLPKDLNLKLVEPLRELFKDEVRLLGEELKIPRHLLWRHPFPGPGLAIRCLGEVTEEALNVLKEVDSIFIEELKRTELYSHIWQAFVVLLPIKTVGVQGDGRSYEKTVALRAVTSSDGMTADWFRFPHEFLASVSNRITNEVRGVNRVVYDITSKPPGTIEWE